MSTPNLWISESVFNATEGHLAYDNEPYETYQTKLGELYRFLVREYGRCIGKVLINTVEKEGKPIGWVFIKRARYEDVNETYLQETWVTVHDGPPKKTIKYYYHTID